MSAPPDTRPLSVLLVDDDPHILAIFELLMEHYAWPFAVARDTESALAHLREHTPDVIVIDLFLPGSDGYKALSEIGRRVDRSRCRILATTAYYTNDTGRQILARGFDGYVPKPFVPDSFLAYLRGAVP